MRADEALAAPATGPHDVPPTGVPVRTLRDHRPGYVVMREALRAQSAAAPRRPLARLLGFSPLRPSAVCLYSGAVGELDVAADLDRLPDDWTVLHAVPIGDGDDEIDVLVIGPGGVFAIDTKHYGRRRVRVAGERLELDGRPADHAEHAIDDARVASALLTRSAGCRVDVTPVLAVVSASRVSVDSPGLPVLRAGELREWLVAHPTVLRRGVPEYLTDIAADPGVWRRGGRVRNDPEQRGRFEALHREVRDASRRAFVVRWTAVAICTAAVLAVVAAVDGFVPSLAASVSAMLAAFGASI